MNKREYDGAMRLLRLDSFVRLLGLVIIAILGAAAIAPVAISEFRILQHSVDALRIPPSPDR